MRQYQEYQVAFKPINSMHVRIKYLEYHRCILICKIIANELLDNRSHKYFYFFRRGFYDGQSLKDLMDKRRDFVKRRLCILPTMSCNLRPNYCCPNTTCRCNLWGQNCRYRYIKINNNFPTENC